MELSRFLVAGVPDMNDGFISDERELVALNSEKSYGLSRDALSPAKSTSKRSRRRSGRKPASCLRYASKTKEVNRDQSGSGMYKNIASSDMNDGFISDERELVALNSEKSYGWVHGRWQSPAKSTSKRSRRKIRRSRRKKKSGRKPASCLRYASKTKEVNRDQSVPTKSTSKRSRRRSGRKPASCLRYASKTKEVNRDQSGSGIYKKIVSSDMNDGFISDERELVALNSEKSSSLSLDALSPAKSTSKKSRRRSGRKPASCLRYASKTKEVNRDQSGSGMYNKGKNKVSVPPQNVITGREGERAAFKYFSSTLRHKKVKWVNKVKESGLPYDILVEGKDKSQEYIEVKSTSVAKKDWFNISMNEWKFAIEKGESFIIARIVLSDGKLPKITTYRNPAKLLQSRHLQLAFHPKYDPIISVTKRKSAWDDNSISGGDSCSQYRIRWKQEGVMDESKWWMTVAAHWILSRRNECHEPNSEGSGSAWKAYMNVRVAGLFLLVLLEYPQREEFDATQSHGTYGLLNGVFIIFFVNAELSFCSLTCFKENPAKSVSVFMNFVPLEGEVHEQTRSLLPDRLIREHLDVGYLHKDTLLSDSLARALGIEECGPKVLIQVIASLCDETGKRWKYDPIISVTKRKSAWDDNSISGGDSCSQYRIRWKQEGVMDESKWWMTVAAHWILSRQKDRSKAKSFERCRSSVLMTMHEVVHEMVVEECHEPNSEGSGSAWKAYMNARVAGLFLLVLLEYPQREEFDAHSPWNQWLLMEFSKFFVNAELSFCSLTCFKENPAKGVSVFMSFVPLEGEVHGFFSQLPHMIISKLCSSSCLLLQGEDNEWVTPSKVLRNWTEQTRSLLPDRLIREHLDVGYLHKDTLLSDSLARALGIEECGPKVLMSLSSRGRHTGSKR
ncbi:histidine kinase-, DNA gyrase B-, and HSP90-like ATPase family protein [Tanacetum coccineum]